jgi:hypothetical protein
VPPFSSPTYCNLVGNNFACPPAPVVGCTYNCTSVPQSSSQSSSLSPSASASAISATKVGTSAISNTAATQTDGVISDSEDITAISGSQDETDSTAETSPISCLARFSVSVLPIFLAVMSTMI